MYITIVNNNKNICVFVSLISKFLLPKWEHKKSQENVYNIFCFLAYLIKLLFHYKK